MNTYIVINIPHGNHKPETYNRYKQKRERNQSITLKTVIK